MLSLHNGPYPGDLSQHYRNQALIDTICIGWEAYVLSLYLTGESGPEVSALFFPRVNGVEGEKRMRLLIEVTAIVHRSQCIVNSLLSEHSEKEKFLEGIVQKYQEYYSQALTGRHDAGWHAVVGKFLRPNPQPLVSLIFSKILSPNVLGKSLSPQAYPQRTGRIR